MEKKFKLLIKKIIRKKMDFFYYHLSSYQEDNIGKIFNKNCRIEVINTSKKNKIIIYHCKLID